MPSFYTGKGDSGHTGFLGGGRISKTSPRIEAIGAVDEANSALGLARSLLESDDIRGVILHIQNQLYRFMSELAASEDVVIKLERIKAEDLAWLEEQIQHFENLVELPKKFIIPGETPTNGALGLARTIIRRAERRTIAWLEADNLERTFLIPYLNRLSSLVFILEVYESSTGCGKIPTVKEG